jgi:hypothetical protein
MVNSRKLTGAGGLPLAENDKSDGPSQRGVYNDQGALRDAAGSLPVQVSAPKTQPAAQNAAAEHAEKSHDGKGRCRARRTCCNHLPGRKRGSWRRTHSTDVAGLSCRGRRWDRAAPRGKPRKSAGANAPRGKRALVEINRGRRRSSRQHRYCKRN